VVKALVAVCRSTSGTSLSTDFYPDTLQCALTHCFGLLRGGFCNLSLLSAFPRRKVVGVFGDRPAADRIHPDFPRGWFGLRRSSSSDGGLIADVSLAYVGILKPAFANRPFVCTWASLKTCYLFAVCAVVFIEVWRAVP